MADTKIVDTCIEPRVDDIDLRGGTQAHGVALSLSKLHAQNLKTIAAVR